VQETTVALGIEDLALQEEILSFLDRLPHLQVVGADTAAAELARRVRERRPDVTVVSPGLLDSAPGLDGARLLVVDTSERTVALRLAIGAGARGFYVWPGDRDALGRDIGKAKPPRAPEARPPGRTLAVFGPRGGAGTTFVATNLAGALARTGAEVVVVDLDLTFADLTPALGMGGDQDLRTLADLGPVLDELADHHLDPVLQEHPAGFRVLLAPRDPDAMAPITQGQASNLIRALRSRFGMVVAHLPRALDEGVRGTCEAADDVLLVISLDVLAFGDARRALTVFESEGLGDRCSIVVNRAARSEVVPEDAERVFGLRPMAVIRRDRAVPRAQNRGELVVGGSGVAARAVRALAKHLVEKVAA
jgi:pilus assembly protein CpaE